ncbi:hypothetical protein SH580_11005 [Coraliomargarita algicola]|uniref:DUF58 domain-containing protein n=1 Tax=Coraliomargarita algicola TaxID=3092156 RepID=A0ABZ0RGQ3_9BACT|nr:hypothetical protein [Coraliomargarita sp. J2-16]WPJ93965.1 hypothetical protein SH580_11005 [Coraliomargarita sp. J2-16]
MIPMQSDSTPYCLKRHSLQAVGVHSTTAPKTMLLFGLPFFGFGLYFTLGSLGLVPFDESRVNGPVWLVTAAGLVFLMAGLMIWSMGLQQARVLWAVNKLKHRYPNDAAMADYPWDRNGFSPPRWTPVRKSMVACLFIIVFASIPNYLAYESAPTPWILSLSAITMNLIVIAVFVHLLRTIWHAVKFGRTRLHYPHFPLVPGESVELEVELPPSIRKGESARLHLRCLKEFYITSGSGKNRSKRLVHEVIYEATQTLDAADLAARPGRVSARFDLPDDQPATRIQGDPPHYWELEMLLKVPGLDLNQQFLIPVYEPTDNH